ncbi:Hint domain-containing protein [Streptomyces sp. NBC_01511]
MIGKIKWVAPAKTCKIGNSFTADTPVLLADGTRKPIKDIQIGDQVLATDPETGETGPRPVTALIKGTGDKQLVDITLDTGKTSTLTATDGHPFWVPALDRWTEADKLTTGQWLQTSTGTWTQITAITHHTKRTTVYNLTVNDIHTYYALAGATAVLVHNDGGFDWEKELENLKKDWDSGDLDDDGYHAPRGNQAENKEFKDALREIEQILGREITPAERRSLHDRITGQGYGYHRIVEEGRGLFGGC